MNLTQKSKSSFIKDLRYIILLMIVLENHGENKVHLNKWSTVKEVKEV